jgi:predicted flap endonuclease-1-like 5' DNA nuclease
VEAVTEAIEFFPGRIERDEWVAQAKELVYTKGKKSEVLENIAKRKHRINYDRIGIAHKEDAQDLTAIHGIGKWIQEKLYALDIFTFKQIANFSKEDIHSVTEVIEFFPGRIERDEWVAQAKKLAKG